MSPRSEADWAILGFCRNNIWTWPGAHGGPKQSNCHFPLERLNHSLDLPQPVMSETPKAYLPGLLPPKRGIGEGFKGEAPPHASPTALKIRDCNTCCSAELTINGFFVTSSFRVGWAEAGRSRTLKAPLEALGLGSWSSGENETGRAASEPKGVSGDLSLGDWMGVSLCPYCRGRAHEEKLRVLALAC